MTRPLAHRAVRALAPLALAMAAGAGAQADEARGLSLTLGAGLMAHPEYLGGEDMTVSPAPRVELWYDDVAFVSTRRGLQELVGAQIKPADRLRLGVAVGRSQGRDSDDNDRLAGLPDLDPGMRYTMFATYRIGGGLSTSLRVAYESGDVDGFVVEGGLGYDLVRTTDYALSLGGGVTWADNEQMSDRFGISASQAAQSTATPPLRPYDAKAGIRDVSVGVNGEYYLTRTWSLWGTATLRQLVGDAADSPVTQQETQPSVGAGVAYRF